MVVPAKWWVSHRDKPRFREFLGEEIGTCNQFVFGMSIKSGDRCNSMPLKGLDKAYGSTGRLQKTGCLGIGNSAKELFDKLVRKAGRRVVLLITG